MESKKINQLATELAPDLSDLTIIGDPTTGISKKITLSQMASLFTGTVEEYANFAAFPLVGVADTIYIALDTNVLYRWDTGLTSYVELSPNIINSLVFSDANGFDGNISLVGSVATLTITTALTTGSVPFIGALGALSQDNANLFFDDTNNRLGLGTNAPTTALDIFGSGIIGRINGTSTNNAFLGFASAGTNRWSIGNVQANNRFRIYNEATTSELISVLSTGEFGIGIANPTTKFHIDGAASALIANLDADVSIAKSISFRSDNSARINLEVSGTESGSNAGANFFLRTYTDAGSLLETPFSIVRSTGATTIKSLTLTSTLNVGTSAYINTDLYIGDTTSGDGRFFITSSSNQGITLRRLGSADRFQMFVGNGTTYTQDNGIILINNSDLDFYTGATSTKRLTIANSGTATFTGALNGTSATFSSTITAGDSGGGHVFRTANGGTSSIGIRLTNTGGNSFIGLSNSSGTGYLSGNAYALNIQTEGARDIQFGTNNLLRLTISSTGAATFSDSVGTTALNMNNMSALGSISGGSIYLPSTAIINFRSSTGTTSYGSIAADTSSNLIFNNKVGIGMTPDVNLQVKAISGNNTQFRIGPSASGFELSQDNGGFTSCIVKNIYGSTSNAAELSLQSGLITFKTGTSTLERMQIAANGDINYGITASKDTPLLWRTDFTGSIKGRIYTDGSPRVYVICNESGGVYLTSGATSWTANSDERLKNINGEIENAVEKLLKLRAVNFSWKKDETKKENLGLIAQDVEKQFPQLIDKGELAKTGEEEEQTDKTEYLGVRYQELIPVLVAAIKELKAEIETLKAK